MPLIRKCKFFNISQDENNFLADDEVLGNCGQGVYRVWIKATAASDATFTVRDGASTVIDAWKIPVDSAASTFPSFNRREDLYFDIRYTGKGTTLPIDIADGTNAEIILYVEYLG